MLRVAFDVDVSQRGETIFDAAFLITHNIQISFIQLIVIIFEYTFSFVLYLVSFLFSYC